MFSGLKDIDREILKYVKDKELLKVCSVSRKMWYEISDDAFLRHRLNKYSNVEIYKTSNKSWKCFFLDVTNYIHILKQKYNFTYEEGNFYIQYSLFKKYDINNLLVPATRNKDLSLVKHVIETAEIFSELKNHLELPHATFFRALWTARDEDSTEIIDYLESKVY